MAAPEIRVFSAGWCQEFSNACKIKDTNLTAMSAGIEKRRNKRIHYLTDVIFVGAGTRSLQTRITDISVGGAFVETITPFPIGATMDMQFHVQATEVRVKGEILYNLPSIGYGLRFLDLAPEHYGAIENLVNQTWGKAA